MRACPGCSRTVCPNCWNLTAKACLRCSPFALAIATPAARPRRFADVKGSPDATPAAAIAPVPQSDRRKRRTKTEVAAAAAAAGPAWPIHPDPIHVDAPWPAAGSSPDPIPTTVRLHPSAVRPRVRVDGPRAASLFGLVVVLVAVFGVAGFAFAAFGHFPVSGAGAGSEPTAAPAARTPGLTPVVVVPGAPTGVDPVTGQPTTLVVAASDEPEASNEPGKTPDPTAKATKGATATPTPTAAPTATATPTAEPTPTPTATPTEEPTPTPTEEPTPTPTEEPTPTPTGEPTPTPTEEP
jgi:hypothetical protein